MPATNKPKHARFNPQQDVPSPVWDGFAHKAQTWDNPIKVSMAEQFVSAIHQSHMFPSHARIMDVGCGTGLVGLALLPAVDELLLVDTSPAMLAVLRDKINGSPADSLIAQKYAAGKVEVFQAMLEHLPPILPVDAIVTLLALHHMEDLSAFFAESKRRLASGGVLVIGDLYTEDGSFHGMEKVPHNGFDLPVLEETLFQQGFVHVKHAPLMSIEKNGLTYHLFVLLAKV